MKYENRVVLFLDILGFKSVIDKTINNDDTDNETSISSLFETLNQMYHEVSSTNSKKMTSRVITQFSDSIVLSFLVEDSKEVAPFFEDIQALIAMLVKKGILCRGAISYGKLIHNNRIVFGPAMNEAYLTESKAALYPRVILDKSLAYILEGNLNFKKDDFFYQNPFLKNIIEEDLDDKLYIDYIFRVKNIMNSEEYLYSHLPKLRKIITDGLRYKSPDIRVKFGWLKNKYNRTLIKLKSEFYDYGIDDTTLIIQIGKLKLIE